MYDIEMLKPIAPDDLVRLGQRYDGGYVLPRRAIAATISCSASESVAIGNLKKTSCAPALQRTEKNLNVGSLHLTLPFLQANCVGSRSSSPGNPCRNFCDSTLLSNVGDLFRMKKAILFPLFFNQRTRNFFPLFLGAKTEGEFVNFDHVFHNIIGMDQLSDQTIFLKMDIEGAEYYALPLLMSYLQKINAMVFEFHHLDRCGEVLKKLWFRFSKDSLSHMFTQTTTEELSKKQPCRPHWKSVFLNKALLECSPEPSRLSYPVSGDGLHAEQMFPHPVYRIF
jgi:hypothetical protein